MIHVGFTGTRFGMSVLQLATLRNEIGKIYSDAGLTFHHGDCIGADAEFHKLVRAMKGGWIVGHIPVDETHRSHCDFDEVRTPLPHMKRNRAIVDASDVMFAAPLQMQEQTFGGTWRTIQMARKRVSNCASCSQTEQLADSAVSHDRR